MVAASSPPSAPRRLSVLAVTSVVLLVVPLLGPLIAPFLGVLALIRIRESQGRLKGRRLALGGIACGGLLLILQAWGLDHLMSRVTRDIDVRLRRGVEAILAAAEEPEAVEALGYWSGRADERIEPANLMAFAATTRERYGDLRSLSALSGDWADGFSGQVVTFAMAFRFDEGDRIGSVTTRLEPSVTAFMPTSQLVEIRIEDGELGELRLGGEVSGQENR